VVFVKIELVRSRHSVGRNIWVLEWCTKYRYRMMGKWANMKLVEACIRWAAHRHGIRIISIKVLPEHVHLVALLPKGMNEEKAAHLLKGASAWRLFRAKDNFALRYPRHHFWSKGYFAHTAGITDLQTQIDYVENQEMHHGVFYTA